MAKRLSEATKADYEELQAELKLISNCACVQDVAQGFVEMVYWRFNASLVLLRLFITVPYDKLPEEDRFFVDRRGRETNTSDLIHCATPIFTLIGTQGAKPEWNDRRNSLHFRCIPLVSTAFVASLSMLSRQFESVGFDLGLIDDWEAKVSAAGRADRYRGMLYVGDSETERDPQGRMIVPKQDFVAANRVRTSLGFGSGYAGHPTIVTLFAFTSETIERSAAEPMAALLDDFIEITEGLVLAGSLFKV